MKSIFILVLRNKSEGFIKIISLYIICGLWWGDAEQENLLGLVPEELWALDHTDIGKFNSALPIKIAINQNQFSSVIQMCPTLCNPMDCSRPGFPVHHQLLELAQTHQSVMPSNYLILCCSLLLLPSIFPSISVFSNKSVYRIRWPNYRSFSFTISTSNECSGLISIRIDWLDAWSVEGTLKSLP